MYIARGWGIIHESKGLIKKTLNYVKILLSSSCTKWVEKKSQFESQIIPRGQINFDIYLDLGKMWDALTE